MLDYIKILKYSYYGQYETNLLLSILTVEKFRGKRCLKWRHRFYSQVRIANFFMGEDMHSNRFYILLAVAGYISLISITMLILL